MSLRSSFSLHHRGPLAGLVRLLLFALALSSLFTGMPAVVHAQIVPPPASAVARSVATPEDTAVIIDTTIPFDSRYEVAIVTPGPSHGTAIGGNNGTNFILTYTPGANRTEATSFQYQICVAPPQPRVCGASALIIVTINPVNDGPIAGADNATVKYGQSVLINVLANDNGGPNEVDTVTLVAGGINAPTPDGTAVIEGNQIRYTAPTAPVACTNNNATFTYLVQDGSGLQTGGNVTVARTCPGTPTLRLSDPYAFSNHTFKIDVMLDSTDINVSALDFLLSYDVCVTDVDTPSNNMVADDVTNMPLAPSFLSQVQDETFATRTLHFVSASTTSPASILAGPSASTSRLIATLQFRAVSGCLDTDFAFGSAGFTGTNGVGMTGATQNKPDVLLASANANPTNITLSNNKVAENSPFDTFIGHLATTDPDTGDTFTYGFAAPNFDAGGKFRIRPVPFNSELAVQNLAGVTPGFYNISVSVTDNYGGVLTKNFAIEVTDRNLFAPIANDDFGSFPYYPVIGRTVIPFRSTPLAGSDLIANDSDPDVGNCNNCSIQSVTNGSKGIVTNLGASVVYIPTDATHIGTDVFTYTLTDNDPAGALTDKATVTVNVQQDAVPGNCNKSLPPPSNGIEAGDLTATGLEIFDGDGSAWYNVYQGSYPNFSPYGCNSNRDAVVDAGDIACTAQKIFNNAYVCSSTLVASSASAATLAVGSGLNAAPGTTVQVPVVLNASGHAVAAAAFALEFNSDVVSFDATDADSDGVADAVVLNIPSGLMATASYNAAANRIEILVTGLIPPFPHLTDGVLATITLRVKDGVSANTTMVHLTNSSLGSDEGQSVPLAVTDGSIQIGGQEVNRALLPLVLSR